MKFGVCPITSYINSDYLQKCMTYLNADTGITYTDWNIPREENQVDLRKKLKTVLLLKGMDTQKPRSALWFGQLLVQLHTTNFGKLQKSYNSYQFYTNAIPLLNLSSHRINSLLWTYPATELVPCFEHLIPIKVFIIFRSNRD